MKALLALALLALAGAAQARDRPPIIDMHLHALHAGDQGPPPMAMCTPLVEMPAWDPIGPYETVFLDRLKHPPCADPVWSPVTDEALLRETLEAMDRLNIVGVVSGPAERVAAWRKARPDRLIPGLSFQLEPEANPAALRALHAAGELAVLGEVTTQYAGIAPDDPRLEPYWALAEELDIPVGIHVGTGPPGVIYMGAGGYRARLHSALSMEEVLVRHPRLRVYLMHAGYPMIDDLLALLYAHPQVYVDVGVIVFTQPRAAFYRYLQRIEEAGFGNRIMFGSDQMVWPGVIERSVRVIEDAPFLDAKRKRDILYNNAARFLRLTPAQIARHERMGKEEPAR
jgi:predicted TIM-barrel fold metal-dependent hydrolase